ncbi:AzlC family ABC transporter permease [Euzebya tangerina]|uniref:AzlC family ABC transporter permease n=1 Tax=Euzebya tangerina TaxID=591198 RepID=UPI000E322F18|nr:AzlC family ABC transporter permease [Euzebya tangerina]
MTTPDRHGEVRPALIEALPVAAAIGVFGVIYGATATSVMTPAQTVASSVLMFSGAAQFTLIGLLDAQATAVAVVMAVAALGLRHLPLAAVLLPRLPSGRVGRAGLALLLVDESAGLAVASPRSARLTMLTVGLSAGGAWVVGTIVGVLGGNLLGLAGVASAVFVILFIGLSALTTRDRSDGVRAGIAAGVTAVLLTVVPQVGAIGAVAVATLVALTTRRGATRPAAEVGR